MRATQRSHNQTNSKVLNVFKCSVCSQESDCVPIRLSHSGDVDVKDGGDRTSGLFQDFITGVPVVSCEIGSTFTHLNTVTCHLWCSCLYELIPDIIVRLHSNCRHVSFPTADTFPFDCLHFGVTNSVAVDEWWKRCMCPFACLNPADNTNFWAAVSQCVGTWFRSWRNAGSSPD